MCTWMCVHVPAWQQLLGRKELVIRALVDEDLSQTREGPIRRKYCGRVVRAALLRAFLRPYKSVKKCAQFVVSKGVVKAQGAGET